MRRLVVTGFVLASFVSLTPVYAQEGPAGAGRAEITIIPAGALFFTENSDASAPSFGNYQLGGAFTYNVNQFIGIEGEVSSSIGISQSLDFGYPSTVRTPDVLSYMGNNPGATLDAAIAAASAGAFTNGADVLAQFALNGAAFIGTFDLNNADTGAIGGADVDGGMVRDAKAAIPNQGSRSGKDALQGFTETYENIATSGSAISTKVFQVGANANQTLETRVGAVGLGAMGLRNTLDVTTSAAQTIVSVDRALDYVNSQRAVIGAQSSRLEAAIANLQIGRENLSASRSRIVDTDFAVETASLARQQILQQAGNAMVVQANQMPQGVLALLRT